MALTARIILTLSPRARRDAPCPKRGSSETARCVSRELLDLPASPLNSPATNNSTHHPGGRGWHRRGLCRRNELTAHRSNALFLYFEPVGRGGSHCARPTRAFLCRALREQRDTPGLSALPPQLSGTSVISFTSPNPASTFDRASPEPTARIRNRSGLKWALAAR